MIDGQNTVTDIVLSDSYANASKVFTERAIEKWQKGDKATGRLFQVREGRTKEVVLATPYPL